ncbi:hypothetical protein [Negativicoccus succinicivorans]|uniref:hypothetical protein n=1 Tax=Negativicoccus succinicivorans TaxID=620903 RepID=UPI0028D8B871|nr:hypothetical protein [Negativicoccus succinicivorans]
MKYFVSEEVFDVLPHYMVGVVVATGIEPLRKSQAVAELFAKAQAQAAEKIPRRESKGIIGTGRVPRSVSRGRYQSE